MSTKPPTRIEVSVPGIRNDRGKLPPSDGAVGAGWLPRVNAWPPPAPPLSGGGG